jgi:hypothetical protein
MFVVFYTKNCVYLCTYDFFKILLFATNLWIHGIYIYMYIYICVCVCVSFSMTQTSAPDVAFRYFLLKISVQYSGFQWTATCVCTTHNVESRLLCCFRHLWSVFSHLWLNSSVHCTKLNFSMYLRPPRTGRIVRTFVGTLNVKPSPSWTITGFKAQCHLDIKITCHLFGFYFKNLELKTRMELCVWTFHPTVWMKDVIGFCKLQQEYVNCIHSELLPR